MKRRFLLALFLASTAVAGLGLAWQERSAKNATARAVLEAGRSFARGGGYDKTWGSSGSPAEIRHAGTRILTKSDQGTYCCGFTFAVAMQVLEARKAFEGRPAKDVRSFQKMWYGATEESAEKQCALAVERFGVGREVSGDEARAGDFAQFWRKKSGHSVLFLGWIELDGERIGLSYQSSQGSTDGIGYNVEYFADAGIEGGTESGTVERARLYFARLDPK